MTNEHKYTVWQGKRCLSKFSAHEDAERFQRNMVAMGALDVRIYDLDLLEVKEKPTEGKSQPV
jgi:hypothetical protein